MVKVANIATSQKNLAQDDLRSRIENYMVYLVDKLEKELFHSKVVC